MFFFGFFWGLGHFLLTPRCEIGINFPGLASVVRPAGVPLFGTILLVSSAISLTWGHKNLYVSKDSVLAIFATIVLGVVFLLVQFVEWGISSFSIRRGVWGCRFFVLTGFHGFHVIIGLVFLFFQVFGLKTLRREKSICFSVAR